MWHLLLVRPVSCLVPSAFGFEPSASSKGKSALKMDGFWLFDSHNASCSLRRHCGSQVAGCCHQCVPHKFMSQLETSGGQEGQWHKQVVFNSSAAANHLKNPKVHLDKAQLIHTIRQITIINALLKKKKVKHCSNIRLNQPFSLSRKALLVD